MTTTEKEYKELSTKKKLLKTKLKQVDITISALIQSADHSGCTHTFSQVEKSLMDDGYGKEWTEERTRCSVCLKLLSTEHKR